MTTEDKSTEINVYKIINELEQKFPVDSIQLSDGTKIWNLLRIILFYYPQQRNIESFKSQIRSRLNLIAESLTSLKYPQHNDYCGFSHSDCRRLRNGKYYDIYMDPLYDILGDKLTVFEWPDEQGYRRKYHNNIYSKSYVKMHFPIFSKAFWNILLYRVFRKKQYEISGEDILEKIITSLSKKYKTDEKRLRKNVNESIAVFVVVKKFLKKILKKIRPKAVFIRCGYGRFHMALSQACRELNIPSIELQHGMITDFPKYHPGYVKTNKSKTKDCVPEYLFTYGDYFTKIVKKGNLLDPEKVITIGFLHLEDIKSKLLQIDEKTLQFQKKYSKTILFTPEYSQHLAPLVETFTKDLTKKISEKKIDVGIVFKPHPLDKKDWSYLEKLQNIHVVDRHQDTYELIKISNVHSTIYSTCALEALAFNVPNIIVDLGAGSIADIIDMMDNEATFIAKDVNEYMEKLKMIFSNYKKYSEKAFEKSREYFEYDALSNIKNFMDRIR